MEGAMRIGELARAGGVTPDAVRLYERRGLLPRARRTVGNYRAFPPQAVERLSFVREAQRAGFSLTEIAGLVADRECDAMLARGRQKLSDLDAEINELKAIRRALRKLMAECESRRSPAECPIALTIARTQ
jgi:MerR family copper efflux transcriptional regulator